MNAIGILAAASLLPDVRRNPVAAGNKLAAEMIKSLPMAGEQPGDLRDIAIALNTAAHALHAKYIGRA